MTETAVQSLGRAVTRAISEYVDENSEEIPASASLEEIGVDSMTLIDIVLDLQNEYAVEFPDDSLAGIHTVQDVIDVLHGLTTGSLPGPV